MKKDESKVISTLDQVGQFIYVVRGCRVMVDQDLAALYGVETKHLNKAVSRNQNRFPEDFAFRLTKSEWESLRFQFGTSKIGRGGRRYLPYAFTEHGVLMAANLLRSEKAIQISLEIVRAFIRMREFLTSQKEISNELSELKSFLLKHSHENRQEFQKIWKTIDQLLLPKDNGRKMGFELG